MLTCLLPTTGVTIYPAFPKLKSSNRRHANERYDHPTVWPWIHALCRGPLDPLLNDCPPTMKREQKERVGRRTAREYGVTCTPLARGRACAVVRAATQARRRARISDLARANASLARTYLPEHHRKFQKAPTRPADAHRSVPRGRNQELSREAEPKRVRRETRPAATPPEAEAGDRECARGPGAAAPPLRSGLSASPGEQGKPPARLRGSYRLSS
jgi:hypothetical protein